MPFKRAAADEKEIRSVLQKFASGEKPFRVDLNGYGAFAPRVIFIRIVEPDPVRELHSRLERVLLEGLHFRRDEVMKSVQPHITVATRDLTKTGFNEAWAKFEEEEFSASFEAGSLFLLKHNGRSWDILEEFPFGRQ
jgi:2'-5' RNA ligase